MGCILVVDKQSELFSRYSFISHRSTWFCVKDNEVWSLQQILCLCMRNVCIVEWQWQPGKQFNQGRNLLVNLKVKSKLLFEICWINYYWLFLMKILVLKKVLYNQGPFYWAEHTVRNMLKGPCFLIVRRIGAKIVGFMVKALNLAQR